MDYYFSEGKLTFLLLFHIIFNEISRVMRRNNHTGFRLVIELKRSLTFVRF